MAMKYDLPVVAINLKKNGKVWVEVVFENGVVWRPRLWEIGAIISGIGKAEDFKYPNGKGYRLTRAFIEACWNKTREQIYELSLSEDFDPNQVMAKRYRKQQCPSCGRYHDGDQEMCELCTVADKAWVV